MALYMCKVDKTVPVDVPDLTLPPNQLAQIVMIGPLVTEDSVKVFSVPTVAYKGTST